MTTPSIARDGGATEPSCTDAQEALAQQKMALRSRLLEARRAMSAAEKAVAETALCARLLSWWQAHPVSSLGVYYPIRQEPDLQLAYNALSAQGVHLSLPIVRGKDLPLDFSRWTPGDALRKDALGTLVPAQEELVQPQALLIPCLGVNPAHIRLGYGGGFYDRTLAPSPRPLTIGVAYAHAQAVFDAQPHDIALDWILTGP